MKRQVLVLFIKTLLMSFIFSITYWLYDNINNDTNQQDIYRNALDQNERKSYHTLSQNFSTMRSAKLEKDSKDEKKHTVIRDQYKDINEKDNNLKTRVSGAKFEGITKEHEPYIINAEKVLDIGDNNYQLSKVVAVYFESGGVEDNNTSKPLHVVSQSGFMDNNHKTILLQHDVNVTYNDIIVKSEELNLKIQSKRIYTDKAVNVFYQTSQIQADSFDSNNSGEILTFQGHVKMTIGN